MKKVAIGVASWGSPDPTWYVKLATICLHAERNGIEIESVIGVTSALPDWNKNRVIFEKGRLDKTDSNRGTLAKTFMNSDAEWLFQIDDDTTPPADVLSRLLKADRDFIAGVYFNTRPPYNPIAYFRSDNGMYSAIEDFPKGTLIQVDSVGMGCTLIHKSVFLKIMDQFEVYRRPNGSLFPLHISQIRDDKVYEGKNREPFLSGGVVRFPVIKANKFEQPFPFFAMEYGRTEDHHFCELADQVGVKPWLDTDIKCGHWKIAEHTVSHFEAQRDNNEGIKSD